MMQPGIKNLPGPSGRAMLLFSTFLLTRSILMKPRAFVPALLAVGLLYLASASNVQAFELLDNMESLGCGCNAPVASCCAPKPCCRRPLIQRCCKPRCCRQPLFQRCCKPKCCAPKPRCCSPKPRCCSPKPRCCRPKRCWKPLFQRCCKPVRKSCCAPAPSCCG